jgi:hypothetical protein
MRSGSAGIRIVIVLSYGLLLTACASGPPSGPVVAPPASLEPLGPPNPEAAVQPKAPIRPKTVTRGRRHDQAKAAKPHRPKAASVAERHAPKRDTGPEVIPLD